MKATVILTVFIFWFVPGSSQSDSKRSIATEEFKVYGNCGMCKTRIESAARIRGVHSAKWDVNAKMLKIEFQPLRVVSEDVHKHIAKAGHDTELVRAKDEVYNKLHHCCKYERPEYPVKL